MATVIGIFENQFKKKLPLTVVRPGHNLEDLHISTILLKPVIMHGKKISVDITVYLIEKVIQLLKLQNYLM
jgi:hypothetical protein